MQKRASNHFLHFTRKERNGIIALLILVAILFACPFFYSKMNSEPILPANRLEEQLAGLQSLKNDSNATDYHSGIDENDRFNRPYKKYERSEGELFDFDPNTLPEAGWKRLGVRDKTIQTIRNFISKGGKFRQAEDIKKIWGLHEDQAARLLPFVKIEQQVKFERQYQQGSMPVYEKKKPLIADVNLADTTAFIALPWIGSKLARRLVDFREKLGGFTSIEQVGETFGLHDSVFQKIKPFLVIGETGPKQININTATLEELKLHPYIRYHFANAIVQFRNQHGNYSAVEDLRKIMIITEEWYNRVYPYLTVK